MHAIALEQRRRGVGAEEHSKISTSQIKQTHAIYISAAEFSLQIVHQLLFCCMPSEDEDYKQYKDLRHASHVARKNSLDDYAFKTSERYDQWVITLAGGALAISLTFLEKIAPNPTGNTLILLGFSWLAYIGAILAGFCAIFDGAGYVGLWRYCSENKMTVLADIHTHPDEWTGQSRSDQTNPMVGQIGHIALIAPFYAQFQQASLDGVGIYEYLGNHNWKTWETTSSKVQIT